MHLTRVIPRPVERIDAGDDAGLEWLRSEYEPHAERSVRLNMITSLTGSATGADGTSDTLSSPVDRRILGVIRGWSDVVVVGAQSVRAERYVVPKRTRLAIVTRTGRLEGHQLAPDDDTARVFLVCAEHDVDTVRRNSESLGLEVIPIPGDDLEPAGVVSVFADRGWLRVVCEGGPTLASQFARAGVIDEFCVSVAPQLVPAAAPFIRVPDGHALAAPHGLLVDDSGFSYLRARPSA